MNIVRAAELLEACVFATDSYATVFDQVADALDLRFFHLTNLSGPAPEHLTGERIHRALEEYQADGVFERDAWTTAVTASARRPGEPFFDRDIVSAEARSGDFYYNSYCPRHDVAFHGAWSTESGGGPIHFAIFRSASQQDFSRGDRQALIRLIPAANRAVRMMVESRRARAEGLALGLEWAGRPSLLINHDGRVGLVTPGVEAMFDHEFGMRGGQLWAADPGSNRRLSIIAAMARGQIANDLAPNLLVRRQGRPPLVLFISPVRGIGLDTLPGARLVVACVDLDPPNRIDARLLGQLFGMTPAEAEVCVLLANGKSIDEIAAARGSRSSSIRQLVKSSLAKAGVQRQAALVSLLSRLIAAR